MKWTLLLLFVVAVSVFVSAEDEDNYNGFEEDDDDFYGSEEGVRVARSAQATGRARGANRRAGKGCRYTKGPWSDCDPATNMRSRTMTLKKGDTNCEATKTITRKCKKAGSRRRN